MSLRQIKSHCTLVVDRTRCTWEIFTASGLCLRSQYWYKHPDTALTKAKAHIDRELAITQINALAKKFPDLADIINSSRGRYQTKRDLARSLTPG